MQNEIAGEVENFEFAAQNLFIKVEQTLNPIFEVRIMSTSMSTM